MTIEQILHLSGWPAFFIALLLLFFQCFKFFHENRLKKNHKKEAGIIKLKNKEGLSTLEKNQIYYFEAYNIFFKNEEIIFFESTEDLYIIDKYIYFMDTFKITKNGKISFRNPNSTYYSNLLLSLFTHCLFILGIVFIFIDSVIYGFSPLQTVNKSGLFHFLLVKFIPDFITGCLLLMIATFKLDHIGDYNRAFTFWNYIQDDNLKDIESYPKKLSFIMKKFLCVKFLKSKE